MSIDIEPFGEAGLVETAGLLANALRANNILRIQVCENFVVDICVVEDAGEGCHGPKAGCEVCDGRSRQNRRFILSSIQDADYKVLVL